MFSQPHFICFPHTIPGCFSDPFSLQLLLLSLLASLLPLFSVLPSSPPFFSCHFIDSVRMSPSLCPLPHLSSLSLSVVFSLQLFVFSVSTLRLDSAPMVSELTPRAGTGPVIPPACCSRTFITFSDDATFEEWFPQGRPPKIPVREVCPVTHRPALYRDPVTDIPYATARAFKIIREAYKKYITAHGLPPTASALGPGPPPPEPLPGSGPRALRQKIVIK